MPFCWFCHEAAHIVISCGMVKYRNNVNIGMLEITVMILLSFQTDKRCNNVNIGMLEITVMILLSFQTDRPGQTVQTQIRLLLEEQSDQGLHCLPFRLHHLNSLLYDRAT